MHDGMLSVGPQRDAEMPARSSRQGEGCRRQRLQSARCSHLWQISESSRLENLIDGYIPLLTDDRAFSATVLALRILRHVWPVWLCTQAGGFPGCCAVCATNFDKFSKQLQL